MIDGSHLPLAENIALTRSVVDIARRPTSQSKARSASWGYSGGAASSFTSPDEARRFENETETDAPSRFQLANVHLQTEKQAEINLAALRAIQAVTHVPLVLHGGSGIPSATRRLLATQYCVKKFNIGTETPHGFGTALRGFLAAQPGEFDRNAILKSTIAQVREAAITFCWNSTRAGAGSPKFIARAEERIGGDLPLKFHPTALASTAVMRPSGSVSNRHSAEQSAGAA